MWSIKAYKPHQNIVIRIKLNEMNIGGEFKAGLTSPTTNLLVKIVCYLSKKNRTIEYRGIYLMIHSSY